FGEGVPRLPFVRGEAWHPHHASVDAALVAQAPRVHAWTVNDRAAIIQMKTLGVHAIITDYPDRVRDVLHA
ncbi:MAG: glycerophosphodiester phosphodiesterase, partial [Chloroflexi bacterium]|nr:glycerophosphodiester phosphodiesterase [Chloroflexota bacterium]